VSTDNLKKVRGDFSERLLALRKARQLSQPQLAQAIGVSNASIGYWETGRQPGSDELKKLADFFNVTMEFMLTGQEPAKTDWPRASEGPPEYEMDNLLEELRKAHDAIADARRIAEKFKKKHGPAILTEIAAASYDRRNKSKA
jgi:transcriptional regulator with XRE-family HTH domain